MNAFQDHALAATIHSERYTTATPIGAAPPRRVIVPADLRPRLGALLVEAGLHLMTSSEPAGRLSSPLAR